MSGPRLWGFWTKGKLAILRDYLPAFTTAAKNKARGVTNYFDLFAGQPVNIDAETGLEVPGSGEIALLTEPQLTTIRLFELSHADALEAHLRPRFPGRDVKVLRGDCNSTIHGVLQDPQIPRWAPTFAFIDPDGPHCHWSTLAALAAFKQRSAYKTELWMLFPVDMFVRLLPLDTDPRPEDVERISGMFGSSEWTVIYAARKSGILDAGQARFEYVNLMRWRLETHLGYHWTHGFEVRTTKQPIYNLVFATDNPAGNDIMGDLYRNAAREFPEMAEAAREVGKAQQRLFLLPRRAALYTRDPALPPFGSIERERHDARAT